MERSLLLMSFQRCSLCWRHFNFIYSIYIYMRHRVSESGGLNHPLRSLSSSVPLPSPSFPTSPPFAFSPVPFPFLTAPSPNPIPVPLLGSPRYNRGNEPAFLPGNFCKFMIEVFARILSNIVQLLTLILHDFHHSNLHQTYLISALERQRVADVQGRFVIWYWHELSWFSLSSRTEIINVIWNGACDS